MILHLVVDPGWHRVILTPSPRNEGLLYRETDSYGIRLQILSHTAKPVAFSWIAFIQALFDIVVFFAIARFCVRAITLNFLGNSSKKWHRALNQHIDVHVLVKRDTARRLNEIKHGQKRAHQIFQQFAVELLSA